MKWHGSCPWSLLPFGNFFTFIKSAHWEKKKKRLREVHSGHRDMPFLWNEVELKNHCHSKLRAKLTYNSGYMSGTPFQPGFTKKGKACFRYSEIQRWNDSFIQQVFVDHLLCDWHCTVSLTRGDSSSKSHSLVSWSLHFERQVINKLCILYLVVTVFSRKIKQGKEIMPSVTRILHFLVLLDRLSLYAVKWLCWELQNSQHLMTCPNSSMVSRSVRPCF